MIFGKGFGSHLALLRSGLTDLGRRKAQTVGISGRRKDHDPLDTIGRSRDRYDRAFDFGHGWNGPADTLANGDANTGHGIGDVSWRVA